MSGLDALGEAELSQALDQICLAEGVARSKLVSVKIIDNGRRPLTTSWATTYFFVSSTDRRAAFETAASIPRLLAVA
jgi:hypothetical protein